MGGILVGNEFETAVFPFLEASLSLALGFSFVPSETQFPRVPDRLGFAL